MRAGKEEGARGERAAAVHRGEAVAAQRGEADGRAVIHAARAVGRDAREGAVREEQAVAVDQADAGRAVQVGAVPCAFGARGGDERASVGAVPVEPVAAEAQFELGDFGEFAFGAHVVGGTEVDVEDAEQQRFIGHGIEAVELGGALCHGVRRVEPVGVAPVDGAAEGVAGQKGRAFGVVTAAAARSVALDAVDPDAAKRVVEKGAVVARTAGGHRRGPGASVSGGREPVRVARVALGHEFQALGGVGREGVEPETVVTARMVAARAAAARQQQVAADGESEVRAPPCESVAAGRERQRAVEVARAVPQFDEPFGRVVEDAAVAEVTDGGWLELQRRLGLEDRVARVFGCGVEGAHQSGFGDEEIVDEELAPGVDRQHLRRRVEIRHLHRRVRGGIAVAGRPDARQADAVGQGCAVVFAPVFATTQRS